MKEKHTKDTASQSILHIWKQELKLLAKDQGVLIFFVLVPLLYPLLYAFIYTNETVREVPAVVVDNNRSSLSREFLRLTDASADLHIVSYCSDMEEAKTLLKERKAYGIIYIPEDFSRDIAKGEQTLVSIYCDMGSMLYYKAMLTATTNASLTMNRQIKIERSGNTTDRQDEVTASPIEYEDVSLFNPQNGFACFLIPAVLMLIVQQTLLLGVGMAAGTARELHLTLYDNALRTVSGKSLAYFMVYAVTSAYMLCVVPRMFSLVQTAQACTLAAFMLPYLLACIFFAMTCSVFVHHREACMMIYVFTSVPLLFISGISWPGASVPAFWKIVSYVFPSTFGINGFVRINNMGATLSDVVTEYRALWMQAVIYFLTACAACRHQARIGQRKTHSAKDNIL